jgi:hypothetical protein
MKLDKQLIKTLGVRDAQIGDLAIYGLSGRQVLQASGSFEADLSEHQKGKVTRNQIHKYAEPRIENGVAISSKRLKEKVYSSGVFYPVEDYEPEAIGPSGQPGEEYVTLSPERWDGNRVNMSGTQTSRTNTGFRGKKPRKGWKRYNTK